MYPIQKKTRAIFDNIAAVSETLGVPVYVVGGFVRDLILQRQGLDIDFVVVGDALAFCRHFKKRFRASSLVTYPKFGTCMMHYRDHTLEFVTAREESYLSHSRKPEVKQADLMSDLSRRDFTINALAMNIRPDGFGEMLDPFNGLKDIQDGLIRTPLEPAATFSDDPLRMMRAVRFAAQLSFKIDPKTFESIKATAERLQIISQERITAEFNKIMLSPKPSIGLNLLESSGLMVRFFPEFSQTRGIEQRSKHHHKDVFYHTLQVIDQVALVSDKLPLRLAALFHDIAKPKTKRYQDQTGWTFHGHEVVGERMSALILHRMKYSREIIAYVQKLVRLHLRPMALVSEEVTDSAIRRLLFLSGQEFDDLLILCRADITSKNPLKVKRYLKNYEILLRKSEEVEKKDRLRAFKSPVDGNEIMQMFDLQAGPKIGEIKKRVEDAILAGEISNEHDAARNYLLSLKEKEPSLFLPS